MTKTSLSSTTFSSYSNTGVSTENSKIMIKLRAITLWDRLRIGNGCANRPSILALSV